MALQQHELKTLALELASAMPPCTPIEREMLIRTARKAFHLGAGRDFREDEAAALVDEVLCEEGRA